MATSGLKKISLVTVSNLIANGVTFLILMVAASALPVDRFASFSLAVSLGFMLTTLLDFGVNVTAVRSYGMEKNKLVLDGMMSAKWLTLAVAALPSVASLYFSPGPDSYYSIIANGVIGAAVLNLWMGCRTLEQANESFASYARNNILYATIRLLAGGIVLWFSKDSQSLYLASFVLPGLLFALAQGVWGRAYKLSWAGVRQTFRLAKNYSIWVFVSSAAYGAVLYSPQFFIAKQFGPVEVSSYGIALSFMGIVTLIANSIRTVLLPKMMRAGATETVGSINLLLSRLIQFFPAFLGGAALILITGWFVIDFWYAKTLPDAAWIFVACSTGLLGTVYVGFFNIAIHSLGMPNTEAINNIGRLLFLIAALYLFGKSAIAVAVVFAVVLLLGELWTAANVYIKTRSAG